MAVLQAMEVFLARGGSEILQAEKEYVLPEVQPEVQPGPHQECLKCG